MSFLLFCITPAFAQVERALMIGIDHYTPAGGYPPSTPEWITAIPELEGCRNDARAMYAQIISRFGFDEKNIDSLFDRQATREAILTGMHRLLDNSLPGDIALIYYAGHGTQVKNSLSAESDKLDESIVPADIWKTGVNYIRDKELAKIFNAFIDKKVKLTLIIDCCHSGSLTRGPAISGLRVRYAPQPGYDVADSSNPENPAARPGNYFLAVTATQSDEKANEQDDDQHIPHGAFTLALTNALNELSVDASAINLFVSVKAILANNGLSQQPSISGSTERQQQTLFGNKRGILADRSLIAVEKITGEKIVLQGGFAVELSKGNELSKFGRDTKDTLVKLQVDTVLGINRSIAHVVKGSSAGLKKGEQFMVTNWVSPNRPLLSLYIPQSDYSEEQVRKISSIAQEIKNTKQTVWLSDLSKKDPYTCVFFDKGKSYIKTGASIPVELKNITVKDILQYCKKDSSFYMELPVSRDDAAVFIKKIQEARAIKIVANATEANYILFGRTGSNNLPAYGFRKIQTASRDSLEALPLLTDCFDMAVHNIQSLADSLLETAMKLSKLRGWLSIVHGPEGGKKIFPYHLEIFNEKTKEVFKNNRYHIGDVVGLKIVRDSGSYSTGGKKFLYVFTLDQYGKMTLISDKDNEENRFLPVDGFGNAVMEKIIAEGATISPPAGTDHYFLLATEEAIQNPEAVFNKDGVFSTGTREGITGRENSLTTLIDLGNYKTRGYPVSIPANWELKKVSFTCIN